MLYTEIPTQRPVTPLLDAIDHPQQLRLLAQSQLPQVADELRQFILYAAGQSGGHFGANLGVIELTVALHYCFNTPHDRLIWDVGHQAYPHKALTGRREQLTTIRAKDGLAAFPIVLVSGGLAIFAYASGHVEFARYLQLPHIPGANEVMIFCAAICGACLAFLWFNAYPAQVFMGDVGALAMGAALGTVAVIVRQEIILFIMGGLFVVEALSVMLQVGSYKTRKKRIFLMAPIHHHYEQKGWKETQVVVRFWIITIVLVLVGLASLKIR